MRQVIVLTVAQSLTALANQGMSVHQIQRLTGYPPWVIRALLRDPHDAAALQWVADHRTPAGLIRPAPAPPTAHSATARAPRPPAAHRVSFERVAAFLPRLQRR